jgi:predicted DCC family thiol-disulfide oxidoreductase YuxK
VGFVRYFKKNFTNPLTAVSLDLRAMAAFRVLLGAILIVDLLMRASDLSAHYADSGILPRAPYIEKFANKMHLSLHMANGLIEWQMFLFAVTGLAAFCVMIGYRTRVATIVAWVLLVSMHNRNTMILNGGDVLFRMLYFWSIFLPLGTRYSVDAALNTRPQAKDPLFFSAATVGITAQIALLYFATALLKTGREWWPEGTASFYALQLDQFVTPFGRWMGTNYDMLRIGTYLVYALEVAASFLLVMPFFFQKIRTLTVFALMFMHLQFDLAMRLGIFPWVDIIALTILLPSDVWDFLARKFKTGERLDLKIYYDGDCGFCRKMVLLLREFFLIPETQIRETQSDPEVEQAFLREHSWVVVDAAGRQHFRYDALVTVFEHTPVFGRIVRILPCRALGFAFDPVYRKIAASRSSLGRVTKVLLPWRDIPEPRTGPLVTFLAVFFTGYIILWNLRGLPQFNVEMHEKWRIIANVLRLDQKWNMFAPYPLKADGWFVMEGKLKDGTTWDLMRNIPGPVSYDKPDLVSMQHKNARWRKFMMNINQKSRREYRLYFGKYTCRTFNSSAPWDRRLEKFELVYMKELSRPYGEPLTTERISLWNHDCFKKPATPD